MHFEKIFTMLFLEIFYWDGYHYASSFALILALNILLVSAVLLGVVLILKLISYGMKSRCRRRVKHQQPVQQRNYITVHRNDPPQVRAEKKKSSCCIGVARLLDVLAVIGVLLCVALISVIPAGYYGFHLLSAVPAFISIFVFNLLCILLFAFVKSCRRRNRNGEQERRKSVFKRYKFAFIFMFGGAVFLTAFFPLFFRDSCLCFYNKNHGILLSKEDSVVLSTRLTRGLALDTVCPEGAPCHVYATLPSNTDSAVFINAHTHYDVDEITVNFDLQAYYAANGATRFSATSDSSAYKLDFEDKGKRTVHSVLLNGLTDDSLYYFEIVYGGIKQYNSTYRTLPVTGSSSSINIAIGGDVGASGTGAAMIDHLSTIDPSLIIVGGDIAYDDGLQACWYSWDMYLDGYGDYFKKIGRVVPMITSVGNHDVGFNAYSGSSLNEKELPLYFYYLPQHLRVDPVNGAELQEVPSPSERKTYFYHLIGKTMQVSLDSGYVASYPDQAEWMNTTLASGSYTPYAKFANYHVPIYPYCFDKEEYKTNDAAQRVVAEDNFVPVFQNFGFKAIFEHHAHLFKKSHPLKDGVVDYADGIVYFGDGNWGVESNDCIETGTLNPGIHETGSDQRHLWILNLAGSTSYNIYPVDITGSKFYSSTIGAL